MSGPRSLRSLLAGWTPRGIREPRVRTDDDLAASAFALKWTAAVGPDVARRSRPTRFRHGVLTILTASSAWSDELSLHAPRIIQALQQASPDTHLHKLRFMVASGRTKLLLEGERARDRSHAASRPTLSAGPTAGNAQRKGATSTPEREDVCVTLARLARQQHALDAARDSAGWKRCESCGRRFFPDAAAGTTCAICAEHARQRRLGAVERALMQAPWLSLTELRAALPWITMPAYDRTKQRLLARWQSDIESAQRRLRRGSVTAEDRVVAWSYLMLATGVVQRDLGRALVTDLLGREWMRVLFGECTVQKQEAQSFRRQKHTK